MKKYTVYVCEKCGFECKCFDEMEKHEADHDGLTVEEMHEWKSLKSFAEYMGSVVMNRKNEETEKEFDEAINKLLEFEKAMG